MNWLDILIVLLVALPTYFGFRKGFLRKLFGLAGIIAGFILAIKFYDTISTLLSAVIKENKTFVNVISFLLIIAVLYFASIWLARFFSGMNSGTNIIDKILGTAMGFFQGVIVASVLLYNLSIAEVPSKQTRESSKLYSSVQGVAPAVFDKVLDLFPGLQGIYNEYKFPRQTEPGRIDSPVKPEENKKSR